MSTVLSSNPFQQGADWLADRTGCLTGSRMAAALDFRKDGKPGADRVKLLKELVAERLTGAVVPHYVTPAMEHGQITEPKARHAYQIATGNIVRLVGFIRHPRIENCGVSCDGLVGKDGATEFKCPETTTHIGYKMAGCVPEAYKPQMALQLAVTGRQWCDFVSFDDRIRNPAAQLFIVRYTPTPEEIAAIEDAAVQFLDEVQRLFDAVTESA